MEAGGWRRGDEGGVEAGGGGGDGCGDGGGNRRAQEPEGWDSGIRS